VNLEQLRSRQERGQIGDKKGAGEKGEGYRWEV
jgi:hypothetical protein